MDMLTRFGIDIEPNVLEEALALYDAFDDPSNPVPVVLFSIYYDDVTTIRPAVRDLADACLRNNFV